MYSFQDWQKVSIRYNNSMRSLQGISEKGISGTRRLVEVFLAGPTGIMSVTEKTDLLNIYWSEQVSREKPEQGNTLERWRKFRITCLVWSWAKEGIEASVTLYFLWEDICKAFYRDKPIYKIKTQKLCRRQMWHFSKSSAQRHDSLSYHWFSYELKKLPEDQGEEQRGQEQSLQEQPIPSQNPWGK